MRSNFLLGARIKFFVETIRNMVISKLARFDKYWETIYGIMGVAIVLDPRYNLKLLELFPYFIRGLVDYEIQGITNICYDLLHEYGGSS